MKKTYELIKIGSDLEVSVPIGYFPKKISWRDKWLAALRSGKYKQGAGRLFLEKGVMSLSLQKSYDADTYCCLGVLSKVQGRLTETGWDKEAGHGYMLSPKNPCYLALSASGQFPNLVRVRYGNRGGCYSLSELNDWGASFEDIAKLIEILWAQK